MCLKTPQTPSLPEGRGEGQRRKTDKRNVEQKTEASRAN